MVLSIIEKCGLPSTTEVGVNGITAIFLAIQHGTRNVREKYLPLIKAGAQRGDFSWKEVALMEDRLLMESGEKQKYGTQVTKDQKTGNWTVYPISDPKNVNQRRREIGLEPIEEYLARWNIKINIH